MGRIKVLLTASVLALSTFVVGTAASAPSGAAIDPTPSFDPFDRAQVWAAFESSILEPRAVPTGWTGSAASCTTGTEAAASITATRAAVNFYRELNNLPPVPFDAAKNSAALGAALLMEANGALNHFPPNSWSCWTQDRYDAAGRSNLSQGATGAAAVDGYIADLGANNGAVGHRRWILDPRAGSFGTGSTNGFNALHVTTGRLSEAGRPAGVSWVTWPSAGYVPRTTLRPLKYGSTVRFSASNNQYPDADYSAATMTVKVGATTLAATKQPVATGYADNTLVYDVTLPAGFDDSNADITFSVTVSGAKTAGGTPIPAHSWTSTVINTNGGPTTVPGAPTGVTATATSSTSARVSWTPPANYGGTPIDGYRLAIYANGSLVTSFTFPSPATTQTLNGLQTGTTYTFKVAAINPVGVGAESGSSNPIVPGGATPTTPGAPTNVQATPGNGQATVSWDAPASNGGSAITGYRVTPYVGGAAQAVRTFDASTRTRTITGLTNGTTYTFRVQAVNAVGIGSQSSASNTVTPAAVVPEYAPFASYDDLIRQVFQRMVGRLPTTNELVTWRSSLQGSATPGTLVASLRTSSRHTTVVDPVARLYWAYFLRIPDRSGLEYWVDQRLGGRSLLSISDFFARSNEFKVLYGSLTNAQFVNQVYLNVLGRPAEPSGLQYWTSELASGRRARGSVMLGFSESPEYKGQKAREVTVAVLHIQLLRRSPTTAELSSGVAAIGADGVEAYATTLLKSAVPG